MHVSTRRLMLMLVCTAVLFATTAGAAMAAPLGLGLGLHAGYGESKDAESGSPVLGVQAEIRPASFLGVVATASYKTAEEFRIQPRTGPSVSYDVYSIPVSLMARIYLPIEQFDPYITAGAQLRFISYDYDDLEETLENLEAEDSETAFGWLAGAGAEFAMSPQFSLFGEARFEFVDADRELDDALLDRGEEFDYDQWHALVGFTFFLNPAQ